MRTRSRLPRSRRGRWLAGVAAMAVMGSLAPAVAGASASEPTESSTAAAQGLEQVTLANGAADLGEPMSLAVLPNRAVLHTSRDGFVRYTDPEGNTSVAGRIPVYFHDEDGLQGITVDPDFAENRWVYLYYSPPLDTPSGDAPLNGTAEDWEPFQGVNRLSRFELAEDNTLNMDSEVTLLEVETDRGQCCHSGGDLDWDSDGNLYLSTGDDTNPFQSDGYTPIDERANRNPVTDAQRSSGNTNDLRGKVLRITPQPDGSYTIPEGNLFEPDTPNTRPEIYAMGFRNPFRFTVDEETGILWLGEMGPDAGAADDARGPSGQVEFVRIDGPGNFGWPYCTGSNTPEETYVDYDFATEESGERFDCTSPTNDSPRNTGREQLPPAQPAWITYDGDSVPEFGDGSESPMGGVAYHFDPDLDSAAKLPRAYDGHVILAEYGRAWLKDVTVDADGEVQSIDDFPWEGTQVIDLDIGPDGALYVLDYGTGWGGGDENSALYRIQAAGADGEASARAASTQQEETAPRQDETVTIDAPSDGSVFHWGDTVEFEVSVSGGDQSACDFVMARYILGHDNHGHPISSAQGCEGTLRTGSDDSHSPYDNVFGVIDARYTNDQGVPISDEIVLQPATKQAEHANTMDGVQAIDSAAAEGEKAVGHIESEDSIAFTPYDLAGVESFTARVSSATEGGTLELRANAVDGPLVGSAEVPSTGGWETYQNVEGTISDWPSGTHELHLVFAGGNGTLFRLDEFTMEKGDPAQSPNVLVFSETAGFRHDSIPDGIEAIRQLGEENGFTVDATEDSAAFTADNLAGYDAVVFLSTTGDVLTEQQQTAFESYIRNGGGYVGVHAASDTEYDWPWYGNLVGAYFDSHPEIQDATVDVEDQAHPSTEHLPARWDRTDEWYNFRNSPRENVHVLASLDESSYSGGTMGDDHPIAWCHPYDGGRSWYTGGGHTSESFTEPEFVQHLLGGIRYATGAVNGECSVDAGTED